MECLPPGGALAADAESTLFLSSHLLRATFQGSVVAASKNLEIKNKNIYKKNCVPEDWLFWCKSVSFH
jgi:hypothetical protein